MLDACMLIEVYWILYNITMVQQNKSRWHMQFSWMDHRAKAFKGSHISLSSTARSRRWTPHRHLPPPGRLPNEWGSKTWVLQCWTNELVVRQLGRTKLDGLGFSWMDHRRLKGRTFRCHRRNPLPSAVRRPPRRHPLPPGRLFNEWGSKTWALLCLTRARDISPILSTLWQITIEVNDQVACEHHQQASWCISAGWPGKHSGPEF